MPFTPEQRAELNRMVRSMVHEACADGRVCANRNKLETLDTKMKEIDFTAIQVQFTEGRGRFRDIEKEVHNLKEYNGRSHEEFRDRIADAHDKMDKHEKAVSDEIEWVRGIRRAWSKIFIALIIAGLMAIGSGALKVLTYFKSLPPSVGGP